MCGEGVLGNDEAALEVIATVDEDEEVAVVDVAESITGIAFAAAKMEPENVDRNPGLLDGKVGGGSRGGVAAIASYDERGGYIDHPGGGIDVNSRDAVVMVFDEAGGLVFHEELEGWEFCGLSGEEVEEVPLGHECYEFGLGGKVGEVGHGK